MTTNDDTLPERLAEAAALATDPDVAAALREAAAKARARRDERNERGGRTMTR